MAGPLTRSLEPNPRLRSVANPRIEEPFSATLGAQFGMETMTGLLRRQNRIVGERLEAADMEPFGDIYDPITGETLPGAMDRFQSAGTDPEVLNERYKELGLKFDTPMPEDAARLIAEAKREEMIRQDIIARGPRGVGAAVGQVGAGLAAMATDPLEVASAFIPVVGPARSAALIARFGRIGGRAIIGGIEGTVGAAVTEPIYYALSREQQLDYELTDALVNTALGGLLGIGLGSGIGAFSRRVTPIDRSDVPDVVRDMTVGERADASRVALAQVATGRVVETSPFTRRTRALQDSTSLTTTRPVDIRGRAASAEMEEPPAMGSAFEGQPSIIATRPDGTPARFDTRHEAQRFAERNGGEARLSAGDGKYEARRALDGELLRSTDGSLRTWPHQSTAEKEAQRLTREGGQVFRVGDEYGIIFNPSDNDLRALSTEGASLDVPTRSAANTVDGQSSRDMDAAISRFYANQASDPVNDYSLDTGASRFADEQLAEATTDTDGFDEIPELRQMAAYLRDSKRLDAEDLHALDEAAAFTTRARAYGETVRTAAMCLAS